MLAQKVFTFADGALIKNYLKIRKPIIDFRCELIYKYKNLQRLVDEISATLKIKMIKLENL